MLCFLLCLRLELLNQGFNVSRATTVPDQFGNSLGNGAVDVCLIVGVGYGSRGLVIYKCADPDDLDPCGAARYP